MNELLEKVKNALRVVEADFDDEVMLLINAALEDLKESNINVDTLDGLVAQAVVFYCKSMFGYDNTDSEKQLRAYERARTKMALSSRWQHEK